MRERINPVVGPELIDMQINRDCRRQVGDLRDIRKHYDLALDITMESCFTDLGTFTRGNRAVFMPDNQIMQKKLGSRAEDKEQQHDPA